MGRTRLGSGSTRSCLRRRPVPLHPYGGPHGQSRVRHTPAPTMTARKPVRGRQRAASVLVPGCGRSSPLRRPVDVATTPSRPHLGQVDTLANKTDIDFVGHGVQNQLMSPGESLAIRLTGARAGMTPRVRRSPGKPVHSAEYMRLALNPGGGSGRHLLGDSGGPDLLGRTDTVLVVNSYVTNYNCVGVGYSARVDVPRF